MSINQRQFDQLTEMGISLWQHKTSTMNSSATHTMKQDADYNELSSEYLSCLAKQRFFIDILQCLDLSIGEISHKKDHLDLGLFNWYFSSKEVNEATIHYIDNSLFSPSIKLISQSPLLKKQLWRTIIKSLL